jgi:hypothetical protein
VTDNPNLFNLALSLEAVMFSLNVSAQNITSDIISVGVDFEVFGCKYLGATVWARIFEEIMFCNLAISRAVSIFTIHKVLSLQVRFNSITTRC